MQKQSEAMTPPAPERLKRYDLVTNYRCGASIEELEPADEGEWVRFEQVEALHREKGELAQALRAVMDKFPSPEMLDAIDDDERSGLHRKAQATLTYAEIRKARAALLAAGEPPHGETTSD